MKFYKIIVIFVFFLFNTDSFAQNIDSAEVEEVIVTAQKKEQRFIDVPVSVTTVSGEFLEIARAGYVQEIVQASPSVTYTRTAGMRGDGVYIRGIGTSLFQSGVEPTVSTVIDGVVLGRTYNFLTNLVDIERVEILRGPQGTLFGKNASGGVLNIVTKDPSSERSSDVYVTIGSNSEKNLTTVFNGAISDNVNARITLFSKERDGFIDNTYYAIDNSVQENFGGNESEGFRAKISAEIDDKSSLMIIADYEDQYRSGVTATTREMPAAGFIDSNPTATNAACGLVPSEKNTSVCVNRPTYNELTHSGISFTYTRELSDHIFKSITSSRDSEIPTEQDVDGHWENSGTVAIARNGGFSESEQFTQEFQLTNIDTSNGLDYTLGFFYFDQELLRNFNRRVIWNAIGFDGTGYMNAQVDSTSWALYGDTTYKLSNKLELIAGLRYTDDELSYDFDRPTGPIIIPNIPAFSGADSGTESNTSGRLGLKYNTDEDTMYFATFSTGYKSPGWDIIFEMTPAVAERGPVKAETAESFEIGLKTKVFNDSMILAVTYFDATYEDYQQQSFVEELLQFRLANVGEISTSGLEIDLFGSPTENLTLSAGLAMIDAEIDSWSGAQCYSGQSEADGCVGGQQNLAGGEVPMSPDTKISLNARYDIPMGNNMMYLTGSYRYQDELQSSWIQYPNAVVDSYGILNLSVGYEVDNYSVEFFVRNAADKFYANNYTNGGLLGDQQYLNHDHERLIGINFKYSFID